MNVIQAHVKLYIEFVLYFTKSKFVLCMFLFNSHFFFALTTFLVSNNDLSKCLKSKLCPYKIHVCKLLVHVDAFSMVFLYSKLFIQMNLMIQKPTISEHLHMTKHDI